VLELSAAAEIIYVVRSRMRPQPLNPSVFDPRNFCELLLADYEPCGRLQFHRGEGPFPLVADAPRLRHALENLLSNALKYSDGPVVVSLTRAAQGYRIEVSDRGIGIPVEDQAGIFEPFFRASNTGAKAGHGLGLCVVQSCIEEQGGRISFVSEPNQGTTFSIDLPSSPPGRAATQGEAVPAPIPAGKLPEPDCKLIMGNDSSVPLARAASGVLGPHGQLKLKVTEAIGKDAGRALARIARKTWCGSKPPSGTLWKE